MKILTCGRQGNFANLIYQIDEKRFLDFYRLNRILRAVITEHIKEDGDEGLYGNDQPGW